MRRKVFTLVEVLVVVAILVIVGCIVGAAISGTRSDTAKQTPIEETTSLKNGRGWGSTIRTVSHDGHKFVALTGNNTEGGVAIIHHPDCPCLVVTLNNNSRKELNR